jgi:hypothetical protein
MTAIGFTGGSHCRPAHDSRLLVQGAARVVGSMAELLPLLTHSHEPRRIETVRERVCRTAPSLVSPKPSSG